jgi:hypothetical protein
MLLTPSRTTWVAAVLIGLILLTRFNHFGDHVYLPDATLSALFLGGLLVPRMRWFWLAIGSAIAVDFYALGFAGISDYCMSIGYWGLIPTYAVVWAAGRWLAKNGQNTATQTLIALGTFSVAFVLSNAFWYAFSDKVTSMSILQFSQAIAKYYLPYTGYAMMYLGFAWCVAQIMMTLKVINTRKA